MRRLFLFLSLILVVGLCAPSGSFAAKQTKKQSGCNPSELPKGSICLGQTCDDIGTTVLDADKKNLIACLKNDSNAKEWKAMSRAYNEGACAGKIEYRHDDYSFSVANGQLIILSECESPVYQCINGKVIGTPLKNSVCPDGGSGDGNSR